MIIFVVRQILIIMRYFTILFFVFTYHIISAQQSVELWGANDTTSIFSVTDLEVTTSPDASIVDFPVDSTYRTLIFRSTDPNKDLFIYMKYVSIKYTDTIFLYNGQDLIETRTANTSIYSLNHRVGSEFRIKMKIYESIPILKFSIQSIDKNIEAKPDFLVKRISEYEVPNIGTNEVYFKKDQIGFNFPNTLIEATIYLSSDKILSSEDIAFDIDLVLQQLIRLPYNLSNGKYYLLINIDPLNNTNEANENNNFLIDSISIIPNYYDFIISNFTLSNSQVFKNVQYSGQFYWKDLENNTTIPSFTSVKNKIYISEDTILDSKDSIICENIYYDFNYSYFKFNFFFPLNIQTGKIYYLIAKFDVDSILSDKNRTNNQAILPVYYSDKEIDAEITNGKQLKETVFINETDTKCYAKIEFKILIPQNFIVTSYSVQYYLSQDSIFDISTDIFISQESISNIDNYNTIHKEISFIIDRSKNNDNLTLFVVGNENYTIKDDNNKNNILGIPITYREEDEIKLKAKFRGEEIYIYSKEPINDLVATNERVVISIENIEDYINYGSSDFNYNYQFYISEDSILSSDDQVLSNINNGTISYNSYEFQNLKSINGLQNINLTSSGKYYLLIQIKNINGIESIVGNTIINFIEKEDVRFVSEIQNYDTIKTCNSVLIDDRPEVTPYNNYIYVKPDVSDKHLIIKCADYLSDYRLTLTPSNKLFINNLYTTYFSFDPNETIELKWSNSTYYSHDVIYLGCIDSLPENDVSARLTNLKKSSSNGELNCSCEFQIKGYFNTNADTKYYVSTDSVLDINDSLIYTSNIRFTSGILAPYILNTTILIANPKTIHNGNFYLIAILDPDNTLNEINKANNISFIKIDPNDFQQNKILLPIDGFISSMKLTKNPYKSGEVLTFQDFSNFGLNNNVAKFSFYLSKDLIIDSSDIKLIYSSTSQNIVNIQLNNNTESGFYNLISKLEIVSDSLIDNWPENNISITPINIYKEKIDIGIEEFKLISSIIGSDLPIKYSFTFKNFENGTANNGRVKLYLSKDSILDQNDSLFDTNNYNLIEPFKSYSLTLERRFKNILENGDYYLILKLNPDTTFEETDYSNNIAYCPFNVSDRYYDLKFTKITSSKNLISEFQSFDIKTSITNVGNSYVLPYTNSGILAYLSKDSILDSKDKIIGKTNFSSTVMYPFEEKEISFNAKGQYFDSTNVYYLILSFNKDVFTEDVNNQNNTIKTRIKLEKDNFDYCITSFSTSETKFANISCSDIVVGNKDLLTNKFITNSTNFFISEDSIFDKNDLRLKQKYVSYNDSTENYIIYFDTNLVYGNYYLLSVVDADTIFLDLNRRNNFRAIPVSIVEPNSDIAIDSIIFINSPTLLEYVNGKIYLKNYGAGRSGNYIIKLYFSMDPIISSDDKLLYPYGYPSIDLIGNQSNYNNFSFKYSDIYTINKYYIIAEVNPANDTIIDSDTTNNISFASFEYSYPNFSVSLTSFTADKTTYDAGSWINVTYKILSNKSTSGVLKFYLSVDDDINTMTDNTYIGSKSYTSKTFTNILESASIAIPSSVKVGDYYIFAKCEFGDWQYEANKEDNYLSQPVSISSPDIDLVVLKSEIERNKITLNEKIRLSTIYTNLGALAIPISKFVTFFSKDTILSNDDIRIDSVIIPSGLRNGYITTLYSNISFSADMDYGKYYILQYLDYKEEVTERTESNNCSYIQIEFVPPTMDLAATKLETFGSALSKGTTKEFRTSINNNGSLTSPKFDINYYLSTDNKLETSSDQLLSSFTNLDEIQYFSSEVLIHNITFSDNLTEGNYYIIAELITNDTTNTDNPANNVITSSITILPHGKDLCIQDSIVGSLKAYIGYELEVETYVQNIGSDATIQTEVDYYISKDKILDNSDMYITTEFVAGLNSGVYSFEQDVIMISQNADTGSYYIIVNVDPKNKIAELNENNNKIAIPVNIIIPGPDFMSTKVITLDPITIISPNKTIEIQLSYDNLGFIRNGYPMIIAFYLSENELLGAEDQLLLEQLFDFPAIEKTSLKADINTYTFTIQLPEKLLTNGKNILVVLDAKNEIYEEDETNNVISFPVFVADDGGGYIISVDEITQNTCDKVNITPNPSDRYILPNTAFSVIEIYTSSGQLISRTKSSGQPVDVSFLIDGIYYARIISDENVCTKQLIINHK